MAETVGENIVAIFSRKQQAAIALCLNYAGLILADFQKRQADQGGFLSGATQFWTNRTGVAADTVYSDAIIEDDEIGFFLAHMMEYGVYLELANDRQNEALRPLVEEYWPKFKADLQAIYSDEAAA